MKIVIENFGPIKTFDYDLDKDVIVTFGNNNIGKSYAMQVVYLLLKNLAEYANFASNYYYGYSTRFRYSSEPLDAVKRAVEDFSKGSEDATDIKDLINSFVLSDLSERFIANFMHSCENTFGNFEGILAQHPIITLSINKKLSLTIRLGNKHPIDAQIYQCPTYLKRASSDFHKSRKANGRLDIYYYESVESTQNVVLEQARKQLAQFSAVVNSTIGDVYFLPASRSGIYSGMSAFSSIIAELSKNKAMLTRKIELPGISEPISDYFLMLSNIREKESKAFSSVYKEIEEDILHGVVSFNRSRSTLVYTPEGMHCEFEMTEVSSMVSEVSPIVAFLKYIISLIPRNYRGQKAKPIVFIEEPEAHLHPKNQIKLINLFAQLHKFDVKMVISSHSNYIFNKLNNLLLKGELTPDIYSAILLRAEDGGSVSSFMPIDDLGVDDTNFLDVTQELYYEREQMIATWNDGQV